MRSLEGVITYIFRGTSNLGAVTRRRHGGVIAYIFRGTSNQAEGGSSE